MAKLDNHGDNIHLLHKNLGETPHEALLRFKKDNPTYEKIPMTYAGRLDPMAEGLLLVLSGDLVYKKDEYLGLEKTYEVEILWGVETDTLDVLGKVLKTNKNITDESKVKDFLGKSLGKFTQKYPVYSSKPVGGIPLFQLAREGKLEGVTVPIHTVSVFDIDYISRRTVSGEKLLEEITSKISKVSGDFRQKEILEGWKKVLEDKKDMEFLLDKLNMTVSSGFYVRQFVSDLAKSFKTSALTFYINRTRIGEFANF